MENAFIDKRIKSDGSPTTAADLAAEELIIKRLDEAWSGVPVVAEETCSSAETEDYFFLVDPLDGTGDFIHGTGEYSVNIALIHGDRPLAAVVAAPAMGPHLDRGHDRPRERAPGRFGGDIRMARGEGSRTAPETDLVALVSRRHGDIATEACLSVLSIGTPAHDLLGPEILPHRLRRGRCLCALRPDHGMGYGGGRPYSDPSGRQRRRPRRRSPHLRPRGPRLSGTAPSRRSATSPSPPGSTCPSQPRPPERRSLTPTPIMLSP